MNNHLQLLHCRFHVTDKNQFLICCMRHGNVQIEQNLMVSLDYTPLSYKTEIQKLIRTPDSYVKMGECSEKIFCWVTLPEDYKRYEKLRVFIRKGTNLREIFSADMRKLDEMKNEIFLAIDEVGENSQGNVMRGWCIAKESFSVDIKHAGKMYEKGKVTVQRRPDVELAFPECERSWIHGFVIETKKCIRGKKKITFCCDGRKKTVKEGGIICEIRKKYRKLRCSLEKVRVFYLQFGFRRCLKRVIEKLMRREITDYETFRRRYMPNNQELQRQRKEIFSFQPCFAIVVPLYQTPLDFLEDIVCSVREQTYTNWKLYLSDGSGDDSPLTEVLKQYERKDNRICVIQSPCRLQIAENTNKALEKAQGDYIVFADHDDMLAPDALHECVKALNEFPETEFLYTDEDKVSMNGKEYYQPHFKPDFNIDLLRSINYICHLCVVKRELFERVGYLRKEYNGSQDYDFILRCVEQTDKIVHIPKILYHWRNHLNSVAGNAENKNYAYDAGKNAILAHYNRTGICAEVEFVPQGYYRSRYLWEERPLVSIIIPNKDHKEDLERCVESIQKYSTYRNFEILIVENNSKSKEIEEYYQELEKKYSNIRVLHYVGEFNYSAIHNYAVPRTAGDYVLFLNNDTWLEKEDSIWEMLSYCMRSDVGVVGAKLLYPDDTIQHAGVIVGIGGVAGHAFLGAAREDPGYFCRIVCTQNYSAVTAACMMIKKKVFEEVGGMEPELKVAFNDTDFCLRVREKGYLIVYQPSSVWYHDESKTRGVEDNEEKLERFRQEIELFQRRWNQFLDRGDPCYNSNLALDRHDFSTKR